MNIIEKLLSEIEGEIGLNKTANDPNGAPESPANANGGQQDIATMATAFMQKVEQFKAQVGQGAAGAGNQQQPPPQSEEEAAMQAQQQGGGVDPNAQQAAGGITVQTPGGSVVKIASLIKIAALHGGPLFREVE